MIQETNARAALMTSAMRAFAEVGYDKASLRDICREANSNVASVKYHFGSKQDLYAAVMEEISVPWEAALDVQAERVRDDRSWREALTHLVERVTKLSVHIGSPGNQIARILAREFNSPSPIHAQVVDRFITPLRKTVTRLVRLAYPERITPADEANILLWCAAFEELCLAQVLIRPSWPEIKRLQRQSPNTWAESETKWLLAILFNGLSFGGTWR